MQSYRGKERGVLFWGELDVVGEPCLGGVSTWKEEEGEVR